MLGSAIGNSRAVMIVVRPRNSGRVIEVAIVDTGGGIRRRCPRVRSVRNGVGRRRGRRSVRRGHLCVSLPGLSCASSARVRQPKRDGRDAAGAWTDGDDNGGGGGGGGGGSSRAWAACLLAMLEAGMSTTKTDRLLGSISRNATGQALLLSHSSQANVNGRHSFPPYCIVLE